MSGAADIAGQLLLVLGSLAVVVAAIFGVALLARRYAGPSLGVASARLRMLGALSVGQRERVVLIEVQGERLLLGVAAGSVRTLQRLPAVPAGEEAIVASPAASPAPSFSALLGNALGVRRER